MTSRVDELDRELYDSDRIEFELGELDRPLVERIATSLDPDDWQKLRAIWRERPPAWQCGLMILISRFLGKSAIAWLLEVIEYGEASAAVDAIDAVRNLQKEYLLILPWPPHLLRRVDELWTHHTGFTSNQRRQLLDDMASGELMRS